MKNSVFRFKHFDCAHGQSSMKIGVDAVLLGAWTDVSQKKRIIDVGTGCGVIALMMAQRNNDALIDAIDVDEGSICEAILNFRHSKWSNRLKASLEDYNAIHSECYDLIISNPPYFNSGIIHPESARLVARHEGTLSPSQILKHGKNLLSETGIISMVIPADRYDDLLIAAETWGYSIIRGCRVRGHENAPVKRLLIELSASKDNNIADDEWESLILETTPNNPTEQYRCLCKEFYLKF